MLNKVYKMCHPIFTDRMARTAYEKIINLLVSYSP